MRFMDPTPPTPTDYVFDVVITQTVGLPATGAMVRTLPTGGSEWQTVLLAETLAQRGYRVGVVSPVSCYGISHGVTYIPHVEVIGRHDCYHVKRPTARVKADVVVSERFGFIPEGIECNRIVYDLHDLPDDRLQGVVNMLATNEAASVVVHSEFAASLLTDFPRVNVIPCMLPDEFYEQGPKAVKLDRRAHHYVYGSAAMKGLEPTLKLWAAVKKENRYHFKKAKLTICSPGYDAIDMKLLQGVPDVQVYKGLSPAGMQRFLEGSDGLFMVSIYPETFGIIFHQCEAAGKPARVLKLDENHDALATTLANDTVYRSADDYVASFDKPIEPIIAHDFRASAHIASWIAVLGLKQQEEKAA